MKANIAWISKENETQGEFVSTIVFGVGFIDTETVLSVSRMFGPRPVTRKLGSMSDDTCRSLHQHKPLTFPNNSKSFSSPENLSETYPIRAVTVSISSLLPDFFSGFPRSSTAFTSFLISSSFCNFWFALDFCHNTHRRFSKITQWAIWRRSLWTFS